MKVFTTHLDQNLMIKMINIKKQQSSNIDAKPPKCLWLFKKFKSKDKRFDGWNTAKGKSEPKLEKSIAERVKLKNWKDCWN